MFCPECGYEYEDGITTCPDCQVKLVAKNPAKQEYDYVELVTVYIAPDYSVVPVAKSLLDDAGIKYFVKNETEQNLIGYTTFFEPIKIMVAQEDAETAREILADLN